MESAPTHPAKRPVKAIGARYSMSGQYISFLDVTHRFPKSFKTRVFIVGPTRGGGQELGYVRWFSRWRCYSFFPTGNTVYEHQCLRDIAKFCEDRTNEHRAVLRMQKAEAES